MRETYNRLISKEKLTKQDVQDGIAVILASNDIYYNSGEQLPLLDEEYDNLFRKISKYKKITSLTKPSSKRLVEVSHEYYELVGTLEKTNYVYKKDKLNEDQYSVEEWLGKIQRLTNFKSLSLLITLKYDGNSVCLILKDGVVTQALTRGEDGKGADVSNLFKGMKFPFKLDCGIKTEIMITDDNFNSLIEDTGINYKKPRSVVAGILSKTDGYKYKDYLSVVPLRIQTKEGLTRNDELKLLDKINRKDIKFPSYKIEGNYKELLIKINEVYNKIMHERTKLNFAIDGIVIEILNDDIRKKLGREKDKNKYDVALKFPPLEGVSTVKDIIFYPSTTASGRITPVLIFDDLIFDGATCNHVSLSNYKRFRELNLGVGDKVIIEYRNDCLSYCNGVYEKNSNSNIKFVTKCPICGEKLFVNKNKTFVYCKNPECEGKIKGKIQNWIEKIGIKGVKENIVNALVDSHTVKNIVDLYDIRKEDVLKLQGFKDKSATNLINAIHEKKSIYDWELLGSLNIENFSRSRAKDISKVYTIDELFNTTVDDLVKIEGVAEKTAKVIKKGINENKDIISLLRKKLDVKIYKDELNKNKNKGESKTIVFTGFRNKELQNQLELLGHKVSSSVSSKTDIVVAKDVNSTSSSAEKARKLGKIVTDEKGLLKLLGI